MSKVKDPNVLAGYVQQTQLFPVEAESLTYRVQQELTTLIFNLQDRFLLFVAL